MWSKIEQWFKQKSYDGWSFVFISDPKTRFASASLTFLVVSFIYVSAALFTPKINFSNSMTLFCTCAGLYLGRKISGQNDKNEIPDISESKKE